VCEEFHCTPSEAEAELERDALRPEPLLWDILDLRRFAALKTEYDAASKAGRQIDMQGAMGELALLEYRLLCERHGITPSI
jgi:hypothetical protein